ncbi:MAG: hypothetical protein AAFN70_06020, partial [Planctomycetota bacterium]
MRSIVDSVGARYAFVAACILVPFANAGAEDLAERKSISDDALHPAVDLASLPDVPPPSDEKIQESINRGVAFLLEDQNANGSWGSATKTKQLNIFAPIPGAHHAFRAATTSLALSALLETGGDSPEVQASIQRGEKWLLKHLKTLRRATGDSIYNVWGHSYSIQTLVRLHTRHADDSERQEEI